MNKYWENYYRENGIKLTVEIELTFDQFSKMVDHDFGDGIPDAEKLEYMQSCERRILPPDAGSYLGIGSDIGDRVRRTIKDDSNND